MTKYFRMTWYERMQHVNLMVNFTLLVITGFALKYPEAFWASPITDAPVGMTLRGALHRLCGVAVLTQGGCHLLYLLFAERGRGILRDMMPQFKDALDLWETLKNNLFINRPAKEIKMGRFNFREKLEYLALIWGTVIMTVTGFILWFKEGWLSYFPMWTLDVARAIHFYEAILATLAIFVWHFYSVIFDPDVYPMNWAWITGSITEHQMKNEHGLELERIKAEQRWRPSDPEEQTARGGMMSFSPRRKEEGNPLSLREIYLSAKSFNEKMRSWRGE